MSTVQIETLEGLQRRLHATIPQQQLRTEMEIRLKRLGRTAHIPGFRPGRAPLKVLEQHYGDRVRREVLSENLQRSFMKEVMSRQLQVAGYPQFELKTSDLNAPEIEYSATFEVYPEVVIGDLSNESVTRTVFTLTDADVEDTIRNLRKQRVEYRPTDRAAQHEDMVRIDFSGTLNGEPFEGSSAQDFTLVLGAGHMLPEFENALVGCKAGESKSFEVTFPSDYPSKELAGKQVTFTVTVHAVETPHLPEIDAKFIKSFGIEDGDVEKFRQEIRENINREAQRRVKQRNKESAMELLLKVSSLQVPQILVQTEAQHLMEQTLRDMEGSGITLPKEMKLSVEMFTERAEKRVKLGLIMDSLLKQYDLRAKPEQIDAMINEYAQSFQHPEEVQQWYRAHPSRLQEIENLVLEDNVVDWVMNRAKVIEQTVTLSELMEQ